MKNKIQLPDDWLEHLAPEFEKSYMQDLKKRLLQDKKAGREIYPPGPLIFNAFNLTPLNSLRVVILGQDPYHGPGQAHGLCFSVPKGVAIPPSLKNIYKELKNDLGVKIKDGNLEHWAKQGIFLLNTTLTVIKGEALSHKDIGWEKFTDKVISVINSKKSNVIFVLWGSHAQSKIPLISREKHQILTSPHPSPLSAHRGFFNSKPFSTINKHMEINKKPRINF